MSVRESRKNQTVRLWYTDAFVIVSVMHSVAELSLFLPFSVAIQLRDLVRYVRTTNWSRLGLELDVDEHILDEIRDNHRGDNQAQQMFQEWLRVTEEPTWEAVVQALTAVGESSLATEIKQRFL